MGGLPPTSRLHIKTRCTEAYKAVLCVPSSLCPFSSFAIHTGRIALGPYPSHRADKMPVVRDDVVSIPASASEGTLVTINWQQWTKDRDGQYYLFPGRLGPSSPVVAAFFRP